MEYTSLKKLIRRSSLFFVSIAIFSLCAKNRTALDYNETTIPELYSLKSAVASFYESTKQKLGDLYLKASKTRSTLFAQTNFQNKRFDRSIQKELVAISYTLEEIQKSLEAIQNEVKQAATQIPYYNEPIALKKEDFPKL